MAFVPWKGLVDGSVAAIDGFSRVVGRAGTLAKDGKSWHLRSMLRIPLVAASGGGGVASVANPYDRNLLVGRVILDRTAGTTGTLSVGVAADGVTSSNNLIDAAAATATLFDNVNDAGVAGKARQRWGASQFVTATASVAPTGLAGFLYIEIMDP